MSTQPEAFAQRPQPAAPAAGNGARSATGGELLVLSTEQADGRQQVILVDVRSRTLGVYHIDRGSGQVSLKSVRNVHSDLQMEEFNTSGPTPREIRSLLDSR